MEHVDTSGTPVQVIEDANRLVARSVASTESQVNVMNESSKE